MESRARYWAMGLALWGAAFMGHAQGYPVKTVRLVVPYGPGTGVDLAARILADHLSATTGQAFVVENKTGAAGAIGGAAIANAPPDGYMLLVNASGHTTLPALMRNISFDAKRDFASVAMIAESPMVLVTSNTSGFASVGALVAAAKAKPDALSYASAGVGTMTHLAAEKFRAAAGIRVLHVPFRSTTDALAEVMAGRIDFLFTTLPSALGPVGDGRLVALAMGLKRSPKLPGVPTLGQAGIAKAESTTWFGMFAPAKTPPSVIAKLHDETARALQAPEVRRKLDHIGADPNPMSTDEFDAVVRQDFMENAELI